MTKTFAEGIDELKRLVGDGPLEGTISVNQVYAHYQDAGVTFKHPRGGRAGYLSDQMTTRRDEIISGWARQLLRGGLVSNMIRDLRSIADRVFIDAPREFEVLRNSTSLKLHDAGTPVFYFPALIPRLTDAELKALRAVAGGGVTPALRRLGRFR